MMPVANLVAQNAQDLLLFHLLDQRVEEHDALIAPETEKEGVRMARTLRAVHHEQLAKREPDGFRERLDPVAQGAWLEGIELVEERLDEYRVDRTVERARARLGVSRALSPRELTHEHATHFIRITMALAKAHT